jgi:hypothetical protein
MEERKTHMHDPAKLYYRQGMPALRSGGKVVDELRVVTIEFSFGETNL